MNLCVITARSGSKRLKDKSLSQIKGESLIQHCYNRAKNVWPVVVACPENDKKIIEHCRQNNMPYYRGSEEDVLDRVFQCAKAYGADRIMRLTADCPAIPLETLFMAANLPPTIPFTTNAQQPRTYPDGWDVEIISSKLLAIVHKHTDMREDREHVTSWIYRKENHEIIGKYYPKNYPLIQNMQLPINLSHLKWSVDTEQDLKVVKALMGDK